MGAGRSLLAWASGAGSLRLVLAAGAELRNLSGLGRGCCIGFPAEAILGYTLGLSLEDCIESCASKWPRCASASYDPGSIWKYESLCGTYQQPAKELGCLMSDMLCWRQQGWAPEYRPGAAPSGVIKWYAHLFLEALTCGTSRSREHYLDTEGDPIELAAPLSAASRAVDMHATMENVDYYGVWESVKEDGFMFLGKTPLRNGTFFLDNNTDFHQRLWNVIDAFKGLLFGKIGVGDKYREHQPCLYGHLYVLYLAALRLRLAKSAEAPEASEALRLVTWLSLGGAQSELDLLQSSAFPVSLWDIVVISREHDGAWDADTNPLPFSFATYSVQNPLPQVALPSLLELLPRLPRPRAGATLGDLPCGPGSVARIETLGFMPYMQMHQLSALRAAWGSVCGAARGPPKFDVFFTFQFRFPGYVKNSLGAKETGPPDGSGAFEWHGMAIRFGSQDIDALTSLDLIEEYLTVHLRGGHAPGSTDVYICGEPVYVCSIAARVLDELGDTRPLIAHLGMHLLHQTSTQQVVLTTREEVARFYAGFWTLLARPGTAVGSANRITAEQVFVQVGVRLPVAHFVGLHLVPMHEPVESRPNQVLLFRSKYPDIAVLFSRALRVVAPILAPGLDLFDMNIGRHLTFEEIARFPVAVLLPHNVHLIRTGDLFALEIPFFVPDAPFIFQFIYPGSANYAGHGENPVRRLGLERGFQRAFHRALDLDARGHTTGVAKTAPHVGELLPRQPYRECPYRQGMLGFCREDGTGGMEACPVYRKYQFKDFEGQPPLTCAEVLAAEPRLGPRLSAVTLLAGGDATAVCEDRAEEPAEPEGPDFDPFDFAYGPFDPWCNMDAYRYWYEHTEYKLLRGLQRFGGLTELVHGLSSLLLGPDAEARRLAVVEEMRAHQRVRVAETVHWWSHALLSTWRTHMAGGAV